MKKLYAFLSACAFVAGVNTASAEKEVTSIQDKGQKVTDLSQIILGQPILLKAQNRDGYLFQTGDKLYLGRSLTSSAVSFAYLFTVESYSSDGTEAQIQLKTPLGHNMPALTHGGSSTINSESVAETFTITKGTEEADGDSIFYIKDTNGEYFNGNQIIYKNQPIYGTYGLYGTFAGWNEAGGNSRYMIYLPVVEKKHVYEVSVSGVDEEGNTVLPDRTYELGNGDSIQIPEVAGYHIDYANSMTSTGDPITLNNGWYKVTGDEVLSFTYVLNDVLFKTVEEEPSTWYFLKIRNGSYCYYDAATNAPTADGAVPTATAADNTNPDAYLWQFSGNRTDGYKLYNKLAGTSLVLTAAGTANGDANYFDDATGDEASHTYTYAEPTAGKFTLKLKDVENAYINQFGGSTGKLCFWVDAASATDGGSLFTVVKYDEDSVKKVIMDAKLATYEPYIKAENVVNGWTTAHLQALKDAVAAKDTATADVALAALKALPTDYPFDANKTYAIISAVNPNFALAYGDTIEAGDSLRRLVWAELPANVADGTGPAGFKFQFKDGVVTDMSQYESDIYTDEKGNKMQTLYTVTSSLLSTTVAPGVDTELSMGDFKFGVPVQMTNNTSDIAKLYLQPGTNVGTFALIGYHEREGGHDRIGVNAQGISKTTAAGARGKTGSNNTLTATGTNGFYLKEVAPPATHEIATGISVVEAKKAVAEGAVFDLTGRKVSKAQKGIFIINGKKTLVK